MAACKPTWFASKKMVNHLRTQSDFTNQWATTKPNYMYYTLLIFTRLYTFMSTSLSSATSSSNCMKLSIGALEERNDVSWADEEGLVDDDISLFRVHTPLSHRADRPEQQQQSSKVSHAKTICPHNGSSTGAYRWCNHIANASEAALAMASLLFQPLLGSVWPGGPTSVL